MLMLPLLGQMERQMHIMHSQSQQLSEVRGSPGSFSSLCQRKKVKTHASGQWLHPRPPKGRHTLPPPASELRTPPPRWKNLLYQHRAAAAGGV